MIGKANNEGWTALLASAKYGELAITQYLLEHGGSDIRDTFDNGTTIWDLLGNHLIENVWDPDYDEYDATAITSLLGVVMLCGASPAELTARLSPEHVQVVEEGARLKAALPAYLTRWRALLDVHCPLISPLPEELQALIFRFEGPATTDELWATGLGAARQRAVRPRADDGGEAPREKCGV
jgi:hypothetical protein